MTPDVLLLPLLSPGARQAPTEATRHRRKSAMNSTELARGLQMELLLEQRQQPHSPLPFLSLF